MTVDELRKRLAGLSGSLPVYMYSDAEGNQEHNLEVVSFHGPTIHIEHATAIVLVPKHGSVGEEW